jgi:hypothetical protein
MIDVYEEMYKVTIRDIDYLQEYLNKKIKQKKELENKIKKLCCHEVVMRVREEGDERSHTECVRCGKWN